VVAASVAVASAVAVAVPLVEAAVVEAHVALEVTSVAVAKRYFHIYFPFNSKIRI